MRCLMLVTPNRPLYQRDSAAKNSMKRLFAIVRRAGPADVIREWSLAAGASHAHSLSHRALIEAVPGRLPRYIMQWRFVTTEEPFPFENSISLAPGLIFPHENRIYLSDVNC